MGGRVLRATNLVLVHVPATEMLAVNDTTWSRFFECFQSWNQRDIRNRVVAAGDHYGIKPLHPPVVALDAFLPQRHFPFGPNLLGSLDSSVERHKVFVSIALDQTLYIPPHDTPVSKRRVWTVQPYRVLARLRRQRLSAKLHRKLINICLQIRVDGRLREAWLRRFARVSGQPLRDGQWCVCAPIGQLLQHGRGGRSLRVTNPDGSCQSVVNRAAGRNFGYTHQQPPALSRRSNTRITSKVFSCARASIVIAPAGPAPMTATRLTFGMAICPFRSQRRHVSVSMCIGPTA